MKIVLTVVNWPRVRKFDRARLDPCVALRHEVAFAFPKQATECCPSTCMIVTAHDWLIIGPHAAVCRSTLRKIPRIMPMSARVVRPQPAWERAERAPVRAILVPAFEEPAVGKMSNYSHQTPACCERIQTGKLNLVPKSVPFGGVAAHYRIRPIIQDLSTGGV
jgi:hypothetical protein